jgi:DNA helicase II / ATP-dependent DNA helicase PcrA
VTYSPRGEQVDVITSSASVLVVAGGAGTGKTTTAVAAARAQLEASDAAQRAARRAAMLSGKRTRLPAPQRALFLSFSRTAVAQVVDRAGGVIGSFGPRLEVATFDGLAWRIVRSYGTNHGHPPPLAVLGRANARVPGVPAGLTYDQLIPAAAALLQIPKVAEHYNSRYCVVICDEFQDTDLQEWEFLQQIAPSARRILLGDVNQCIYHGFKAVQPAARIAAALALPGSDRIDLEPTSFRDPSGILPAAADAARERRFTDSAITAAVKSGRLSISRIDGNQGHAEAIKLARQARARGHTVSLFTHTTAATTELSDALTTAGMRHEQVGFGEAPNEALPAQLALAQFAFGESTAPVRRTLAVYATAAIGVSKNAPLPAFAQEILSGWNPTLEAALAQLLEDAVAAARNFDVENLADTIAGAYARFDVPRGQETWRYAAQQTRTALRSLARGSNLTTAAADLLRARDEGLVGNHTARPRQIQVMNLHQTKGREADTTILLLGSDEWHGYESEPFPTGSRLLYVVMTRARHSAHIVVPADAHPLWRPLVEACTAARGSTANSEADSHGRLP